MGRGLAACEEQHVDYLPMHYAYQVINRAEAAPPTKPRAAVRRTLPPNKPLKGAASRRTFSLAVRESKKPCRNGRFIGSSRAVAG